MLRNKEIIEVGDTVLLVLGGPEMLVEIVDLDNLAHCVWFNHSNELQKDSFHIHFLKLHKKDVGRKTPTTSGG